MDSTDKYWVWFWGMTFSTLITIVITIALYWNSYNKDVADVILNSDNPMEAVCAIRKHMSSTPVCVLLANGK